MTEEQIKQNAEEYILPLKTLPGADENITFIAAIRVAFEAGAHSRDEEIKELQEDNLHMESLLSMHRKMTGEYELKLQKLSNPWISVEDRLPKKTRNLSPFPDEYDEKVVIVINKQGGKRLAYRDYKGVWRDDYTCEIVNQNYAMITHWMPIPELS